MAGSQQCVWCAAASGSDADRARTGAVEVKYTDVDFWVFTEGAKHVAAGGSPYARTTYRYSPLMCGSALLPALMPAR